MGHFNLPEGWTLAHYNDVYISASNGTGGSQNKEGAGIPVSRIETIANENIDYDRIGFLEKYDEAKIQRHKLMKGDILFSHINSPIHLGKTAIYDGKHTLYHGINLLRIIVDKSVILPQIFNWHCKYTRSQGEFSLRAQHAVNQSSLNQKKLGEFEIPIPPLAEQRIIVEKLDTLLAKVETTKARLERIPEILKTFRQSVLAAAVSGKLTEKWHVKKDYSEWSVIKLEKLITASANGLSKRSGKEGEETRILRLADFKDASRVYGKERNIKLNEKEIKKYSLINDDILVIRVNGSVDLAGKFIRYEKTEEIEGFCDHFIRLRLDQDKILSKYLTYVANEGTGRLYLQNSLSTSAGQNTINQASVKGLDVPLPSLQEQAHIVRRVEELFALADNIEQKTNVAFDRINKLTQSVLDKAFRGELTANWRAANADLINGENSAESLLKKITTEQKKLLANKPRRRKRCDG